MGRTKELFMAIRVAELHKEQENEQSEIVQKAFSCKKTGAKASKKRKGI